MIGMGIFMSFIIVLAVLMINSKNDDLVDSDYYEKGINYNDEYTRKENVKRQQATPVIELNDDQLIITFSKDAQGTLRLIRTADVNLDRKQVLKTDSLHQVRLPIAGLASGLWKVHLDWNSEGLDYLYEKEVML